MTPYSSTAETWIQVSLVVVTELAADPNRVTAFGLYFVTSEMERERVIRAGISSGQVFVVPGWVAR